MTISHDGFVPVRRPPSPLSRVDSLDLRVSPRGKADAIPAIVRWAFMLFVFTLPFETAELKVMSGSLSLAKISGFLFFASYFFYYNSLSQQRSFPHPPQAMWWFLGYIVVYTLHGFFLPEEFLPQFFSRVLTLVQLLVLFWVTVDLLKQERMARSALLSYAIASSLMALGMILQLPGFSEFTDARSGRMTALGANPNIIAMLLSLATVILIGFCLDTKVSSIFAKGAALILTLPLLAGVVNTGSRSGIGTLLLGCLLYLLPTRQSKSRLIPIILAVCATAGFVYLIISNPVSLARWEQLYYEGNMAGREKITPTAVGMILERPLFGWQPVAFWYELGTRLGRIFDTKDAHNLYLHLFLEVGALGALPFLVGLWLCGRAAWE
ncbi:MAG: O-antigen ligase family protein, partial [Candidatus Entotheonellia bacterium]